jgi:hypothetical protein
VVDRFQQRILTQAWGLVTFTEINAHLDAEIRDHGVDLPELVDARAATTDLTPAQIRQLVTRVHHLIQQQPFGPTAFVITNDYAFGMARMFCFLAERDGLAAEVFRDLESASAWLDQASQRTGLQSS